MRTCVLFEVEHFRSIAGFRRFVPVCNHKTKRQEMSSRQSDSRIKYYKNKDKDVSVSGLVVFVAFFLAGLFEMSACVSCQEHMTSKIQVSSLESAGISTPVTIECNALSRIMPKVSDPIVQCYLS